MFHPSELELTERTEAILADVERLQPERVVFDSLSELRLSPEPPAFPQAAPGVQAVFSGVNARCCVLDDLTVADRELQVQSIAHGVVSLEQFRPGVRHRAPPIAGARVSRCDLPRRLPGFSHPSKRRTGRLSAPGPGRAQRSAEHGAP